MKPVFLSIYAVQKFMTRSKKKRKSIAVSNSNKPSGSQSMKAVLIGKKVAVYRRRIMIITFQKCRNLVSGNIMKGRRDL